MLTPALHKLEVFEYPGYVVTRAILPGTRFAVDAYVHYLRTKLGSEGDRIETVRGIGYRLVTTP